ncbi:hypothetical protein PPSIR1_24964 [Plesiocystis pacifica SIR-1]|uniref:DUF2169 domain-containing protein n=1 Tax=Plesiocystis pacifica SIR-1 TaxID=391625 RepID=A6G9I7_9BACT|nr:DUF2169 domain-containing protein [Plesiocystis pacifica]EDM77495.1 hypothetical protein PPSIR1_24964 [Plesiocystis pacifica SIR-1]
MELQNFTPVPAILWRTIVDDDRMAAAVVARITYRIVDGRLLLDSAQDWPIDKAEYDSPAGLRPPEDCFYRGGVDLIVLGSARAPRGQPAPKVEVRVYLDDAAGYSFVSGVDVYGERLWTRSFGGELVATAPRPFVECELSMANAFGGVQTWDQLPVPHVSNPEGKGYYTEAAAALEQPLANIEDPRRPVQRWSDHPDPVGVGFCPPQFGPKATRNTVLDERGVITKIEPSFFNEAFPDLVAPPPPPHARCQVYGVREQGAVGFRLPTPPLVARVRLGDKTVVRELAYDQIGVEPDLDRVFITYRYPFRYTVERMQARSCELHWSPRAHEG